MNRRQLQKQPRRRDTMTEKIERLDWTQLADRNAPLPTDIPIEVLIERFKQLYQVQLLDSGVLQ